MTAAAAKMKAFNELLVMPTCNAIVNKSMIRTHQLVVHITLIELDSPHLFSTILRYKCITLAALTMAIYGDSGAFVWSCSGKPPALHNPLFAHSSQ